MGKLGATDENEVAPVPQSHPSHRITKLETRAKPVEVRTQLLRSCLITLS
jgi:hypothetical protein